MTSLSTPSNRPRSLTSVRFAHSIPSVIRPGGWSAFADTPGPRPGEQRALDVQSVAQEASTIADARGRTTGSSTPRQRRHVESIFAISLTVGLLAWLLATSPAAIPVGAFVASVAAFTGASLIEFEIGPGSVVPTTPVMIVSLFLLPPPLVPIAAVLGLSGSSIIQRLHDPSRHVRAAVMVSSSFYTVGPSIVFAIAGISVPHVSDWPVFLAAFMAQVACDAASAWLLNCYRLRLSVRALVAPLGFAYLVDLLLAPLGYLIAFSLGSAAGLLLLAPVVLLLFVLQRDRRRQLDQAILLATHDPLTNLPNRALFHKRLEEVLHGTRRVAVLLVDLDRFKEVNDTLGHARGDELLIEMGQRLSSALVPSDMVARLGGDEFALFMEVRDDSEVMRRADYLLTELRRPFSLAGVDVDLEASIGVATPDAPDLSGTDLLRRADIAMYAAKEAHEGIAFYCTDLDHYSTQRLALAGRLRRAIEEGELVLHYQPQVDLATGALVGLEALVRWQPPGSPMVPPDDFVGLAERSDLIHPFTRFVLDQAIKDASQWYLAGQAVRVAVNLSPRNLVEDGLAERVRSMLRSYGLPAEYLEIELTETTVMANPERSARVVRELSELGVSVSIDDFGTGHSSLSYLTTLPAHQLKIDRSFIGAMETERSAEMVVRAILDLAQALHLTVVAEGVETESAATRLRAMGCEIAQGYYYSRPLALCDVAAWRRAHDGEVEPLVSGDAIGMSDLSVLAQH
jgi:diguanylate cyclase (GGDEF)-like protein